MFSANGDLNRVVFFHILQHLLAHRLNKYEGVWYRVQHKGKHIQ